MLGLIMPKIFPRWIVKLLLWTGLLYMMYPVFYKYAKLTLGETLDRITDSAELKAVLGYAYGDLGEFLVGGLVVEHWSSNQKVISKPKDAGLGLL